MTAKVNPQVARRFGQRTCFNSSQEPLKYRPIGRSGLNITKTGFNGLKAFFTHELFLAAFSVFCFFDTTLLLPNKIKFKSLPRQTVNRYYISESGGSQDLFSLYSGKMILNVDPKFRRLITSILVPSFLASLAATYSPRPVPLVSRVL